ncbi:AraC family transcriptional regulator [Flammeovirga pectinis]|uniref:AraC family transcriptional regulator n=1 Tax=Flammeovirga pectinis TaxID=2494373 RepID=A0A3Q9FVR0_9BACT|nr:AraC family transcriptional regulator [Flammeovirga pectinis]AZQ65505.1 AraC family transcriptional regulator [Flammeovirga pectinis]
MSLTEIINYSTILKTKILPVKMQELYYMFLNGIKKVDTSTTSHNHKVTEEQLIALFNIRQGILENLNERPDVGDLVSKSGIDKTLIQQLFHEVFGYTIYNFYMVNRMERVKNVLLKGKLSMSEIAEKFGFSHVQHFSSTFKKYFDESPSRFVKLNK